MIILQVSEYTARIGLRLLAWKQSRYLTNWKDLVLLVRRGQAGWPEACHGGGSPWYLHGCWYNLPTEVDVANPPRPNIPVMVTRAVALGENCEVVFPVPEELKQLPYGRYSGTIQYMPEPDTLCQEEEEEPEEKPDTHTELLDAIPPMYHEGAFACSHPLPEVPKWPEEKPRACILGMFDIDYGPRCDEHITDFASTQISAYYCDEDSC